MSLKLPKVPTGAWCREYPFKPRYLALDDHRALHYVDEGQGPPVVMVHGNPSWSFMYRRLIKDLSGFRRLAPDHLGMGLSVRPDRGYGFSLKERLSDFSLWLDSLRLTEPIHLMVHDWGGPIGLGWAGQNPDRVASLTIMNTGLRVPFGFSLPARLAVFKSCGLLGRLLAVEFNLFAKGLVRYGSLRPFSPAAREGFLAPYQLAAHRESLARFVTDIPYGAKHKSRPTLSEIDNNFELLSQKPTLLAWGLKDFVFSKAFLDDFRRRLPQAQTLALPRAGHCLLEDEPEIILQTFRDFLERVGRKPKTVS
jgi:haloalkane dehalogenase